MHRKRVPFLVLFSFTLSIGLFTCNGWAKEKQYIIDPQDLSRLSLAAKAQIENEFSALGEDGVREQALAFYQKDENGLKNERNKAILVKSFTTEKIIERTHQLLREKYPRWITKRPNWIWNNVGGIYARMMVVFCSMDEYVAIFGTQIPQEGYSGRYKHMDVYDVMMTGKMWSYSHDPKLALPLEYGPGDISVLNKKESRHYKMDEFTYMIDYGRGEIRKAFYQGIIAPFLFNNHNSDSLKNQLKDCGLSTLNSIAEKVLGDK